MSTLHTALECLRPVSREEIPSDDADLSAYIRDLLIQARLIVESVPEPSLISPSTSTSTSASSDLSKSPPPTTLPTPVGSSTIPALEPKDIAALQKEWGKPLNKVDNAKDNLLRIPIYKLKCKDGKATWFARRSVHVGGLPFSRFKEKLQNELAETLKIRNETGEVGNIRGVGSEKCLEKRSVPMAGSLQGEAPNGTDGNELATIEVHHLSAHFPGPSTSRDFVTFLVASDKALEVSCPPREGNSELPRSFVLISKPCKHPDAPVRPDYVRGEYESVEMIREVPVTNGGSGVENPVEWIMITRSDPGGNIPKWMVEKGTIPSIVSDAKKFIDWASQDDPKSDREDEKPQDAQSINCDSSHDVEAVQPASETKEMPIRPGPKVEQTALVDDAHVPPKEKVPNSDSSPSLGGILGTGLIQGVASALESVAPKTLLNYVYLPDYSGHTENSNDAAGGGTTSIDTNDASSGSSVASFASADSSPIPIQNSTRTEVNRSSAEDNYPPSIDSKNDIIVPSIKETNSTVGSSIRSFKPDFLAAHHSDKEIAKLEARKAKVIKELEENHDARSKLLNEISEQPGSSISSNLSDEIALPAGETKKNDVSNKKQLSAWERKEAKLSSRLRKLETQQQKLFAKIQAKRSKEAERDEKVKLKAEIETLKKEKEQMKSEMDELREERSHWLSLIARLQQENTKLVAEQRKGPGSQGDEVILNT